MRLGLHGEGHFHDCVVHLAFAWGLQEQLAAGPGDAIASGFEPARYPARGEVAGTSCSETVPVDS